MVQIAGTYKHVSNSPDFENYLKSVKVSDALAKRFVAAKPTITFSEAGGVWTRHMLIGDHEETLTFKLGEPYDQISPEKVVLKNVTTLEGNKLITETDVRGVKDRKTHEFDDSGFTLHYFHPESNSKSTSVFKRV